MFEELIKYNKEILELLEEISSYKKFEDRIKNDLKILDKKYEEGEFGFEKYQELKQKILRNHSKKEEIGTYRTYILNLADKIEFLNTQIFLTIYNDDSKKHIRKIDHVTLPIIKKIEDKIEEVKVEKIITKIDEIDNSLSYQTEPILKETKIIDEEKVEKKKISKTAPDNKKIGDEHVPRPEEFDLPTKKEFLVTKIFNQLKDNIYSVFNKKPVIKTIQEKGSSKASLSKIKSETITKKKDVDEDTIKSKKRSEPLILRAESGRAHESIEKAIDKVEVEDKKTALDLLKEERKKQQNPMNLLKGRRLNKNAKETFLERFNETEKPKSQRKSKSDKVNLGGILNIRLIRNLFSKIKKEDGIIRAKTSQAHSLMELKELIGDNLSDLPIDTSNFLTKETTQLKKLLDQKSVSIYNPTSVGYLANFFVRKITLNLIESYPNFFKNFYLILRQANIKILSNTYVNIMFFLSFLSTLSIVSITIFISILQKNPFVLIFAKAFVMTIISFFGTAGAFYYYPNMKVGERLKSINTNMPFAIDQMSSVVSSGVPPATMFKLIAKTKEYGEVSVEIEKISNLIEVFGYDLVSSIRSVTSTTPSKSLKEFFEGLVSTIETGGSLKNYLGQKSKEALLAYQTERQKYVESISTYSDIYTGLLIAAPLFFVSTLSLVSLLGGKIGGMEVSTVIAIGTYVIIPVLNVLFIIFLEVNQPQV